MAKKKKVTKKKPPVRYRAAGKAKAAKKRPRTGARSQVLPGMEQVRSRRLDNLCEGIGECRETKNTAVTEEKGLEASALQVMVAEDRSTYRHGGVELARIPGAEKLRVRLTKETGDAGDEDLEPASSEDPLRGALGEGDGEAAEA